MVELGEAMMARTRYAMERLAEVPGVRIPFAESHHVKEFVLDLGPSGRTVADVNAALLEHGFLGGADLSGDFPELGQPLLVAVTEVRTQAEIDGFAEALREVLR
jgi:glycine dehydrogenase subunit 1